MTPLRRLRVPVVVLALTLSSCGSGGSTKSEPAPPLPTTEASTTLVAGPGGQFCDLVRSYNDKIVSLAPSLGDPEALRGLLVDAGPVIDRARQIAPPEVAADVSLLAESSRRLLARLQAVDFDFTKLPPEAVQSLQTPEVAAASQRLQAYTRSVCQVGR